LDSIVEALANTSPEEPSAAARAVPALRGLLPRVTTSEDSARTMLYLAAAYNASGDKARACAVLDSADALAKKPGPRELLGRLRVQVPCERRRPDVPSEPV
jgi:hypothetical protein